MLDDGKTTSDKKYVAFAVAATKENRTVTSTYDVMIQSTTNSITKAIEIDTRSTIKSSIAEEGTLKNGMVIMVENLKQQLLRTMNIATR